MEGVKVKSCQEKKYSKYRYLKKKPNLLNYSNKVFVLSYFPNGISPVAGLCCCLAISASCLQRSAAGSSSRRAANVHQMRDTRRRGGFLLGAEQHGNVCSWAPVSLRRCRCCCCWPWKLLERTTSREKTALNPRQHVGPPRSTACPPPLRMTSDPQPLDASARLETVHGVCQRASRRSGAATSLSRDPPD